MEKKELHKIVLNDEITRHEFKMLMLSVIESFDKVYKWKIKCNYPDCPPKMILQNWLNDFKSFIDGGHIYEWDIKFTASGDGIPMNF